MRNAVYLEEHLAPLLPPHSSHSFAVIRSKICVLFYVDAVTVETGPSGRPHETKIDARSWIYISRRNVRQD